jgi:hypothetical protein
MKQVHEEEYEGHPEGGHANKYEPLTNWNHEGKGLNIQKRRSRLRDNQSEYRAHKLPVPSRYRYRYLLIGKNTKFVRYL